MMNLKGSYLFNRPVHIDWPYGWVQHIPFAFYLVESLKPTVFVELGVHSGNSYFSFCQAVNDLKINTKCYAVDTWEGDEHASYYGKEVYSRLKIINTDHFAQFSYLLRMKFDDAISYFGDSTIDLLHIDGLHTYEAVKHDFETWLPKLTESAVVLMHDTSVKERGFGVWKYFEEIKNKYPSFEFLHGHGLGVICVGKKVDKDFLHFIEQANEEPFIQHLFASLGSRVFAIVGKENKDTELQTTIQKVKQSEKEILGLIDKHKKETEKKDLEKIKLVEKENSEIAKRENKILDLQERIEIVNKNNKQILTELKEHHELSQKKDQRISQLTNENAELRLAVDSNNTKINITEQRLNDLKDVNEQKNTAFSVLQASHNELRSYLGDVKNKNEKLLIEKSKLNNQLKEKANELKGVSKEQERLRNDLQKTQKTNHELKKTVERRDKIILEINAKQKERESVVGQLRHSLYERNQVLKAIAGSKSWRITRPLRYLGKQTKSFRQVIKMLLNIILMGITFRFRAIIEVLRIYKHSKIIKKSNLFNSDWYLNTYQDVKKAGIDPVIHYLRYGATEGRCPSPDFDSMAYLEYHEDVSHASINPLIHYVLFGNNEGRETFKANNRNRYNAKGGGLESSNMIIKKEENWYYNISEEDLLKRVRQYNVQKSKRKAKVVLYTAIIGGYDTLILPETIIDEWDYVIYTDSQIDGEHIFEVRKPDYYNIDPTRIARYIKTHPHLLLSEYQYSIWIDSNILVRGTHLIKQVRDCQKNHTIIMINPHPDRKSIYEELEKCRKLKKDDFELMDAQINRYKKSGFPDNIGLYETNIIIRKHNHKNIIALNNAWWKEIDTGSRRDQLSLPYVLWLSDIKAKPIPNMINVRKHNGNDYCLFNHVGQKRNKNVPFYKGPSFLKTNYSSVQSFEEEKKSKLIIKQLRTKLLELGFVERAYDDLCNLLSNSNNRAVKSLVAWELALWHVNKQKRDDCQKALEFLQHVNKETKDNQVNQKRVIIEAECYNLLGDTVHAISILKNGLNDQFNNDILIALANVELNVNKKIMWVNKIFNKAGLLPVSIKDEVKLSIYDSLYVNNASIKFRIHKPENQKVTIIVPAYNAAKTISTSINSLLVQTYLNLEIIIVDDCSTDDTVDIIRSFKKQDNRIKLIECEKNQGPYIARNMALQIATGELITCHDADDWSHPEKIAFQVKHFNDNQELVANVSQWARITEDFKFSRRNNPGHYIQLNISSLMFKREVVMQKLGYWDSVRFGADTEFYKRLIQAFGRNAVAELPPVPLSFARYSDNSLTGDATIGYPGYPMGARKEYRDSYLHYFSKSNDFKYVFPLKSRPFPIPKVMDPLVNKASLDNRSFDTIIVSDFRIDDQNVKEVLKDAASTREKGHKIGLIHMEIYDLVSKVRFDSGTRDLIDGEKIEMLVYGDKVSCEQLIVAHHQSLACKQQFIPTVFAKSISVVIDSINDGVSIDEYFKMLVSCGDNLNSYFHKPGVWYPSNKKTFELLHLASNKKMIPVPIADSIWSHPVAARSWENTPINIKKQNIITQTVRIKEGKKSIILIDIKDINDFSLSNPDGVAVIMPCIDIKMGMDTAHFLYKRAGMDCVIVVVEDTLRTGFMSVLNNTAAKLKAKYVVYLAQDAYPGIDWLKTAFDTLEITGKGLLAFNDGKWKGRVASFGMVRIDWVKRLYSGPVFYSGYNAHKADNELTVIARVQNMFVYDPNATLVEIDKEKIFKENIPEDKELFRNRFRNGFNGLLPLNKLKPLAKEYFVPWENTEVLEKVSAKAQKERTASNRDSHNFKYENKLSPIAVKDLIDEYKRKGLNKEENSFILYRIIGNDLYPRHKKGQSFENLRFIINNESNLDNCEKRFVVNRIIDQDQERAIIDLLNEHGLPFIHIPFDRNEYNGIGLFTEYFPTPGFLASKEFQLLDKTKQDRALVAAYRLKNNYIMNNNGARNAALRDGKNRAMWVMPWDGNCFLTKEAWEKIYTGVISTTYLKYFVIPMSRVRDNTQLLSKDFRPNPVDEPQIIFRKDAKEEFSEDHCYGRRPKVELFWRLGVPGRWDSYPKDDPWDIGRPSLSNEAGQFGCAGWVARLYSGNEQLEKDNKESIKKRAIARVEAVLQTIGKVDKMVSGTRSTTLTSFNENMLDVEKRKYNHAGKSAFDKLIGLLIGAADKALTREPYSVIDKITIPPSGKMNDYWHPAPYWWPNPKTKDGLPYIRKDGIRVPGTSMYEEESNKYDRTRLQRVFDDSTVLALANFFTEETKYATHAVKILERFFVNPETRMNANLNYGQVRMGHDNNIGSNTGIIESKDMYYYLDAVRLLSNSGVLSNDLLGNFQDWLSEFLKWLLESPQGKTECTAKNNHGTCYDLQVASIASFLNNQSVLAETFARAQSRIPQQFSPDGTQPHEMGRTITTHYCCFNFQSWINMAEIASRFNIDLWNFESTNGTGLRNGALWLINHIGNKWPYKQIDAFDNERFFPIYFITKEKYNLKINLSSNKVPRSKHLIKPVFHPHDGIRPFWNLS